MPYVISKPLASRGRRPPSRLQVEKARERGGVTPSVWEKVKVLEKVAEVLEEPPSHRLYEGEGTELKRTIETLHSISLFASINNQD